MTNDRRTPESEISDAVLALHKLRAAMTPPDQQFLADLDGKLFAVETPMEHKHHRGTRVGKLSRSPRLWIPERAAGSQWSRALSFGLIAMLIVTSTIWLSTGNPSIPFRGTGSTGDDPSAIQGASPIAATDDSRFAWTYRGIDQETIDALPIVGEYMWNPFPEMAIADGRVVRLVYLPDYIGLEAIDATNGEPLWTRELETELTGLPQSWGCEGLAIDARFVYRCLDATSILVLDARTGEPVRTLETEGANSYTGNARSFITSDGVNLVVFDAYKSLSAFDVATGERRWTVERVADISVRQPHPYVGTEVIVAVGNDGAMTAYDLNDGSVRWTFTSGLDPRQMQIEAAQGASTLTVAAVVSTDPSADVRSTLFTIDIASGVQRWQMTFTSDFARIHAIDSERVYAGTTTLVGQAPGTPTSGSGGSWDRLLVLDIETGASAWQSTRYDLGINKLHITDTGHAVALRFQDEVTAFHASNGTTQCSRYFDRWFQLDSDVAGNLIIVSLLDGRLVAIDANRLCDA